MSCAGVLLWRAIALILVISILPSSSSALSSSTRQKQRQRQEVITARHGAVAADDRRCSRIGSDVLREGGHAVDAAVAVAICLGVVSPASSGLGGGSFMVLRLANGEAKAFDMREVAPLLASQVLLL